MSRNLCRTDCDFCNGVVALVESPRPIIEADAGRYFELCKDLTVAHAECVDCQAQYLAWVNGTHFQARFDDEGNPAPADLSFRSTFNDEPGDDDLPKWKIGRVRVGPWIEEPALAAISPQPPEESFKQAPCDRCGAADLREHADWCAHVETGDVALSIQAVHEEARYDALARERDALAAEVARLRGELGEVRRRRGIENEARVWTEDVRDSLECALDDIAALARDPIRDQDPWAVIARIGEMAEAALGRKELSTSRAHEAVQKLVQMAVLYPGYLVKSRGPLGLIVDAIGILEPETGRRIRGFSDWEDWRRLLDSEEGGKS